MRRFFKKVRQLFSREHGVAMAEYALLLALIAVALVVAVINFRNEIIATFDAATNRMANARNQAN